MVDWPGEKAYVQSWDRKQNMEQLSESMTSGPNDLLQQMKFLFTKRVALTQGVENLGSDTPFREPESCSSAE